MLTSNPIIDKVPGGGGGWGWGLSRAIAPIRLGDLGLDLLSYLYYTLILLFDAVNTVNDILLLFDVIFDDVVNDVVNVIVNTFNDIVVV